MEEALIQALTGAGSAGVLAGLIFYMHIKRCRETEKRMSEDRESSEKRIADICEGHEQRLREDRRQLTEIIKADRESREDNTRVLTALTTAIDRMNGHR